MKKIAIIVDDVVRDLLPLSLLAIELRKNNMIPFFPFGFKTRPIKYKYDNGFDFNSPNITHFCKRLYHIVTQNAVYFVV